MEFEIAKKLEKVPANVKGNSLRSIKADRDAAQMIIVADAYGDIKSGVENFRMMTNADITFRLRGKSIDVSVMAGKTDDGVNSYEAINTLMEFAKTISFNRAKAVALYIRWHLFKFFCYFKFHINSSPSNSVISFKALAALFT